MVIRQTFPAQTTMKKIIISLIAMLLLAATPAAALEIMTLAWDYTGSEKGDQLGYAVNTAGDVNGDGFTDIIIGVPKGTQTIEREGIAHLFHGGPTGPSQLTPDQTLSSGDQGADFGGAVSTAGDVNGDGFDDVIIGAPSYKNGTTQAGAVFAYYGSSQGIDATPDWVSISPVGGANLGISLSGAGDVNGDGFDDIIVGASEQLSGTVAYGAAFLFFGATTGLTDTARQTLTGTLANTRFGFAVSAAGDVNGDGFADVVVGAPHFTRPATDEAAEMEDAGAVFLFFGSAGGLNAGEPWMFVGNEADLSLGAAVSAGDVNGDGYSDIIIGTAPADPILQASLALAFFGGPTGPGDTPDWQKIGEQTGSGFGRSVAGAGDVNGDGFDDVLVGAYRYTNDQREEGAAFIFFGSESGPGQLAGWRAEGDKADTFYGFATATGGNTNQDRYADIVIGAPQYRVDDKDVRGRAFVYLGTERAGEAILQRLYLPLIIKAE